MKKKILNKVLITGGAKRLGSLMAERLAKNHFCVCIQYFRSKKEALEIENKVKKAGGEVFLIRTNIENSEDCKKLIKKFFLYNTNIKYENFLLINNASAFEYDTSTSFNEERFDLHMKVNFKIPTFLIKYFALNLPEKSSGSVINMLDAKLFGLNSDHYSYTLSKFALLGLTKMAALSYAPKIRVNAIAPGITLPNKDQNKEDFERIRSLNPLKNGAFPEEIFDTIMLFVKSKSITGETAIIDGGAHLSPLNRDASFL